MSSLNPLTGAPPAGPPKESDFQNPAIPALQADITSLSATQPPPPDMSAFNSAYQQQQQFYNYLSGVASGAIQTQADKLGQQQQQINSSLYSGQAQRVQGQQATGAARIANEQQATSNLGILSQTAQASAQERQQDSAASQNTLAVMQNEQLGMNQLQQNYQQAVFQRQQALLSDTMQLSSMQAQGEQSYQQALYHYQETQKQMAIQAQQAHNDAWMRIVGGSAMVVGGVVGAILLSWTGVGIAGGVGLAVGGAGMLATGIAEQQGIQQ